MGLGSNTVGQHFGHQVRHRVRSAYCILKRVVPLVQVDGDDVEHNTTVNFGFARI